MGTTRGGLDISWSSYGQGYQAGQPGHLWGSRFDSLHYQIVDILRVQQFNLSSDALEESAALDQAASLNNPRLIVAVVAAEEEAIDVAEMYQSAMEASSWEVQVFPCMADARDWIRSQT